MQIRYSMFKFERKAKTLELMQGVQRSKIEAMKAEGKEEASILPAQNAPKVGFIMLYPFLFRSLYMSQYVASTPPL